MKHRNLLPGGASAVLSLVCAGLFLSGCRGPQSTLAGAGAEASAVETLLWVLVVGSVLIWTFVVALAFYLTRLSPRPYSERSGSLLIVFGGAVFPTIVLAALLVWGLWMMPVLRGPANGPTIAVSAERFWWRIAYDVEGDPGVVRSLPAGGVESANELVLPVGLRSEILIGSPDVAHSFWVPAIAGKMDAIPGRVNRLVVEPTREGVFNGVCSEFCGEAHAQMGFRVVVVPLAEYEARVAAMAEPVAPAQAAQLDSFLGAGCGACHSVRGTPADGSVGPDLTHLASRRTLGGGLLPMSEENIARFISETHRVKPGVEMPSFGMLPEGEIEAIAAWLGSLR